jgi:hypothetical protein
MGRNRNSIPYIIGEVGVSDRHQCQNHEEATSTDISSPSKTTSSSKSPSVDPSQHALDLKSLESTLAHISSYLQNAKPVPNSLLTQLNNYTVDSATFLALDKTKERIGGRYVYLRDGKIRLDMDTQTPHAEIIGEILRQISIQDNVPLLISGSGGGTLLEYIPYLC